MKAMMNRVGGDAPQNEQDSPKMTRTRRVSLVGNIVNSKEIEDVAAAASPKLHPLTPKVHASSPVLQPASPFLSASADTSANSSPTLSAKVAQLPL